MAASNRAALVSTVPLNARSQGGKADVQRTLAVCERILEDCDDMVTKAMSWGPPPAHRPRSLRGGGVPHEAEVVLAARVKREVPKAGYQ